MEREADAYAEMLCNITLTPCGGACDQCKVAEDYESGKIKALKAVPDIEERKYFTSPNFCTLEEYDCFLSGRCDTCHIARDEEAL